MPEQKTTTHLRLKLKPLEIGSILEGRVISKKRGELYVDLSPYGTGRLYGSFYLQSKNLAQKLNPGDVIGVKIVGLDDGYGNYEILLQELSAIDRWQKILSQGIGAWMPIGWALVMLFFWFPGLTIYLFLRKFRYKMELQGRTQNT
jgi:hypothetical protein